MTRWWLPVLALAALPALPQSGDTPDDLAKGRFLVADRKLADPNFAESVVLLLQYDAENGAMGVIINRPSRVPLPRVLPDIPVRRDRPGFAYQGGPVEEGGARILLRSRTKPSDGVAVIRGVYLLTSVKPLRDMTAADQNRVEFRAYLGYAGWAAEQLEAEVEAGAWHILRADPGSIFDPEPATLWRRLLDEAERSIAYLPGGRTARPPVLLSLR